ncbi:MAG: hypothetical protein AMXMBFR64_34050 [Myxococcales bacterium]
MSAFQPSLSRAVHHRLPTPIALPAQRYEDARDDLARAAHLFDCVESTLRLLALLATADQASRGGGHQALEEAFRVALQDPGPARWWALLEAAAGGFPAEGEPFLPELHALLRDEDNGAAAWRDAVARLVALREDPGLDRTRLEEGLARVTGDDARSALATLLGGLEFLSRLVLLMPQEVLDGPDRKTVLARRLHGARAAGQAVAFDTRPSGGIAAGRPILLAPDTDTALGLWPFVSSVGGSFAVLAGTSDGELLCSDGATGDLTPLLVDGAALTLDRVLGLLYSSVVSAGLLADAPARVRSTCGTLPSHAEVPAIYTEALLLRVDDQRDVLLAGDPDAWEQLWLAIMQPQAALDARRVRHAWELAQRLGEPPSDRLVPVVDFGWAPSIGRFVLSAMAEPGTTLARRLAADGSLGAGAAATIARDIIDAVAAVGELAPHTGPSSVLLDDGGRARLLPFPVGDDPGGVAGVAGTLDLLLGGMTDGLRIAVDQGDWASARREVVAADGASTWARDRLAALQAASPGSRRERARRAAEAMAAGDAEAAVLAWEELSDAAWSPAERVEALLKAGALYADALGDPIAARTTFEAALTLDPACGEASARLEADAEAREDWQRLSGLLLDRFEAATEDEARAEALRRLRPVFEERLGDVDAAFYVLRRLLDVDKGTGRLDEIERLAAATGRWDDLVSAYDALRGESVAGDADLACKAARVLLEQEGKVDEALERLRVALEAAPEHLPALELYAEALAAAGHGLDGARVLTRVAGLLDGAAKADVLARAAGAAESAAGWAEAVLHHQARAAMLGPAEAAAVWVHIGELQAAHLGSPGMARAAFEHALTVAPEVTAAWDGLEELARATGDAGLLRDALMRRVTASRGTDRERAALTHALELGAEAGLDGEARAGLLRRLRAVGADDAGLLDALLDLAHDGGRWDEVVGLLGERAERLGGEEGIPALMEQARVLQLQLGAPARASRVLEVALERKPGDPVVQDALISAYRESQQWSRLAQLLESHGISHTEDARRVELLVEAGQVATQHLKDEARAIALYETALEIDPTHPVAARDLAAIYTEQTQGARALPLVQVWANHVDAEADPEGAVAAWTAVGRAADLVLRHDVAANAYGRAVAITPSDVDARVGLAAALTVSGQVDAAIAAWTAVLDLPALPDGVRSRAQTALGELAMKTGSTEESRTLLERAHVQSPGDEKVLRDLIGACDRLQDWAASVRYRMELSKLVPDRVERGAVLMQAGDLAHDALKDIRAAIEAYRQAQNALPGSKATAARLLRLYLDAQEYEEAIETLRRLIELEEDPKKKGSHRLTLALIYRDHLRDDRRAVAYLNETLDDDPLRLEAFEALDAILVRRKAWEEQAESYERMLERIGEIPGQEALAFRLLRNQAEILTSVRQIEPAIYALERARALKPTDPDTRFALARLMELDDAMVDDAIAEYQTVIQIDGGRAEAYRSLRRLYTRTRAADAAWCACGVLSLFGQADENEQAYYEAHRQGALKVAHVIKTEDTWPRHLYADGQDPTIGALLLGVYRALPERFDTDNFDDLRLTDRNHVDLRVRTSFSSFAGTIPKILGVEKPEFFLAAQAKGIRRLHMPAPAYLLGPDVHDGLKGKRLRFTLGKAMAYLHLPHRVATALPPAQLQAALEAAYLLLTGNEHQVVHAPEAVQDWFRALGRSMGEADRAALRPQAELLFRTGVRPDVAAWQAQVEMTANHAGLLLCNDIEVAIECLEAEPWSPSKLTVKEKTRDLVRYAIAPRYHALRKALGIAIPDDVAEA